MPNIEMRLKKGLWAVAAVAFAVFTSSVLSFMPINVRAADPLPWNTPAGTEGDFNNINFLGRIRFDSPTRITDLSNNVVYATNETIFGNQNEDFFNNGGNNNAWYIYAPVGQDGQTPVYSANGRCYGVYMLELDKDGAEDNDYAWLHAMQPVIGGDGQTCVFDGNGKRSAAGRVSGDVNNRDEIVEIGKWGEAIDGESANFRNVAAPLFWRSQDIIGAFDSGFEGFTILTSPRLDAARNFWTTASIGNVPSLSARQQDGWRFFGNSNCASGFVAVDSSNEYAYLVKDIPMDIGAKHIDDGPFDQCVWNRDISQSSGYQFGVAEYRITLAYVQNATLSADQVDDSLFAGSGTTADPASGETAVTCNNSSNSAIGWIICPVLDILDNMTERMTEAIQGFLLIDMDQFSNDTQLYQAWNVIRQISTVIIVIIALVMIFSEAMGAGFMDNYSVKKLLPRLILAGIGIQLSWVLLRLLIEVTNALGNGIGGILMSPFDLTMTDHIKNVIENSGGAGSGLFSNGFTGSGGSQGVLFGALVIGGAALLGIGSIFGLAIGVVSAVIIGFITLILRNIVIYLGMVLAPIGIALSVLPGTQKLSKLWWESFEKALIMFPLIMGLLASGRIVSKLILDGAQGGFEIIAGIVAWYAPFFLLPATLKLGGTVLSKVSGAAGNANKGFFDKARNWDKSRADAKKKFNQSIKDNRTATRAAAGGLMGGIAAARIRAKNGQNVTGFAFKSDKKEAMRRSYENLQNSVLKKEAEEADALLKKETYVDEKDGNMVKSIYGNSDKLLEIARDKSKSRGERQAAINRLVTLGSDQQIRDFRDGVKRDANGNEVGREQLDSLGAQLYNSTSLTGEFAGAFKDKAPDLVKGDGGAFGKRPSPAAAVKWSKDTWNRAYAANPNMAAEFTATAQEIADDPQLWREVSPDVRNLLKVRGVEPHVQQLANNNPANNNLSSSVGTATGNLNLQDNTQVNIQNRNTTNQPPSPRERINSATPEQINNWVDSRGGHSNLSDTELAQIINTHGASSAGQAARDELNRRGTRGPNGSGNGPRPGGLSGT